LRTDGIKLTAKVPGFVAAGRRVENHTGAHTPMICGDRAVSRGENKAFACVRPAVLRNWAL
jgi:hypothetical protein